MQEEKEEEENKEQRNAPTRNDAKQRSWKEGTQKHEQGEQTTTPWKPHTAPTQSHNQIATPDSSAARLHTEGPGQVHTHHVERTQAFSGTSTPSVWASLPTTVAEKRQHP